ncbi:MAG: FadR family transcriptional regulator [Comamonadaceae bacterium]|nr:MAG: FadR family transcriptional regulator [Comamonadaceae bacterium]
MTTNRSDSTGRPPPAEGFTPRRRPLVDQVIGTLRQRIISGQWQIGNRIPTEPELAAQLGVSRNTTREAVRAVAHNGLLDIRQGSGTYVVATSELVSVMRRRFEGVDPSQIAELRTALEVGAAQHAAHRRTDREVTQLSELLAERETAWRQGDASKFIDADGALHRGVVAASHNDVLKAVYADLDEVLSSSLRESVGEQLLPARYTDHARLVEAIIRQDAAGAIREASSHTAEWNEDARTRGPIPL